MKTNELKKGARVKLRNGWEAVLEDNARGNTRLAKVYGNYTELGSVYSHDIVMYIDSDGADVPYWRPVEHTKKQMELMTTVKAAGF